MTRMLLTGFEPFAGAASNPSWDAAQLVADGWDRDDDLTIECLPVTFADAGRIMEQLVETHRSDIVVATGLANGRAAITPERVATNVEDARIPDNAHDRPVDRAVETDGPVAYWTGLPAKAIVEALWTADIPAAVSDSAGTYVCNSLMYHLMRAVEGTSITAGFIHVPATPEVAVGTEPSLPIDTIARGIRLALDTTIDIRG